MTLASIQNITRSIANSISLRIAWASFNEITAAVSSKRGTVTQWRFVSSSDNPADDGTRSSCSVDHWLTGPSFLQEPESLWPQPSHSLPDLSAEFEIPFTG